MCSVLIAYRASYIRWCLWTWCKSIYALSTVLKVCRYGPVRCTGTSMKDTRACWYFHALTNVPVLSLLWCRKASVPPVLLLPRLNTTDLDVLVMFSKCSAQLDLSARWCWATPWRRNDFIKTNKMFDLVTWQLLYIQYHSLYTTSKLDPLNSLPELCPWTTLGDFQSPSSPSCIQGRLSLSTLATNAPRTF